MSLLRLLLIAVIGFLVFRMLRVFTNIKRESNRDERFDAPGSKPPDDFMGDNIKDAEFEDLTPPEDPPKPPKSS
jgi:hypothetical protein